MASRYPTILAGPTLAVQNGQLLASQPDCDIELAAVSSRVESILAPLREGAARDVVTAYRSAMDDLRELGEELHHCVERLHQTLGTGKHMLPSRERDFVRAYEGADSVFPRRD